ncbi:MAG: baseplate J/gp47 family protein [Synergistales bacterium]|nr:baseplate J/gp47 family protein [Synergistales bacterium]
MFSDLDNIQFTETDTAKVESYVLTTHEAITGKKLYPGDPERLFLEGLAALIAQQRVIIDYTGKQNLLGYAQGNFLDHLGVLTDTTRLEASAAKATMQYSIAEPLGFAVLIPAGSRVTPGGQIYFATTEAAEIPAGDTSVTVTAQCQTAGSDGNGFVAGQINKMVDVVENITSVANTDTSLGGSDEEADDNFRQRIRLAPEKYSTAGPYHAYVYWAQTAHQDIADVSVLSPTPGQVNLYVLMTGGELPQQTHLDDVEEIVSSDKRRPLTDQVSVQAPAQVSFDVDITYYISTNDAGIAASIQDAVQDAVDAYILWQKTKIGRDINPSDLIRRIQQAGAKRVEVTSPAAFQTLDLSEVAADGTKTVTYGGLEDA